MNISEGTLSDSGTVHTQIHSSHRSRFSRHHHRSSGASGAPAAGGINSGTHRQRSFQRAVANAEEEEGHSSDPQSEISSVAVGDPVHTRQQRDKTATGKKGDDHAAKKTAKLQRKAVSAAEEDEERQRVHFLLNGFHGSDANDDDEYMFHSTSTDPGGRSSMLSNWPTYLSFGLYVGLFIILGSLLVMSIVQVVDTRALLITAQRESTTTLKSVSEQIHLSLHLEFTKFPSQFASLASAANKTVLPALPRVWENSTTKWNGTALEAERERSISIIRRALHESLSSVADSASYVAYRTPCFVFALSTSAYNDGSWWKEVKLPNGEIHATKQQPTPVGGEDEFKIYEDIVQLNIPDAIQDQVADANRFAMLADASSFLLQHLINGTSATWSRRVYVNRRQTFSTTASTTDPEDIGALKRIKTEPDVTILINNQDLFAADDIGMSIKHSGWISGREWLGSSQRMPFLPTPAAAYSETVKTTADDLDGSTHTMNSSLMLGVAAKPFEKSLQRQWYAPADSTSGDANVALVDVKTLGVIAIAGEAVMRTTSPSSSITNTGFETRTQQEQEYVAFRNTSEPEMPSDGSKQLTDMGGFVPYGACSSAWREECYLQNLRHYWPSVGEVMVVRTAVDLNGNSAATTAPTTTSDSTMMMDTMNNSSDTSSQSMSSNSNNMLRTFDGLVLPRTVVEFEPVIIDSIEWTLLSFHDIDDGKDSASFHRIGDAGRGGLAALTIICVSAAMLVVRGIMSTFVTPAFSIGDHDTPDIGPSSTGVVASASIGPIVIFEAKLWKEHYARAVKEALLVRTLIPTAVLSSLKTKTADLLLASQRRTTSFVRVSFRSVSVDPTLRLARMAIPILTQLVANNDGVVEYINHNAIVFSFDDPSEHANKACATALEAVTTLKNEFEDTQQPVIAVVDTGDTYRSTFCNTAHFTAHERVAVRTPISPAFRFVQLAERLVEHRLHEQCCITQRTLDALSDRSITYAPVDHVQELHHFGVVEDTTLYGIAADRDAYTKKLLSGDVFDLLRVGNYARALGVLRRIDRRSGGGGNEHFARWQRLCEDRVAESVNDRYRRDEVEMWR